MASAPISATQQELRTKCGQCGHSLSFHGKRTGVECRAMGCRGGTEGGRCESFSYRNRALDPIFKGAETLSA